MRINITKDGRAYEIKFNFKKINNLLFRVIYYGNFSTFSVKSNLGVSPISSIPYIISLIADIDQGLCTTIIFTGFIYYK